MKRIFLLLLVLIVGISTFLSCKTKKIMETPKNTFVNYIPYYLKVYEADSLYIVKNYQKSYDILDSLFKVYKPVNMSIYYEVTTYYSEKIILNKKIAVNDFSDLISKYGLTDEILKNDSILSIYYLKEKIFFDQNYNSLKNKNLASLNINLRNEIKEMAKQDQCYRKKNYQESMDKQNKIDSVNSKKAIEIFEIFGYPNEYLIGNSNIDNSMVDIVTILLHTKDSERLNYFMPKVLEFIKNGKAPPKVYASLKDQFNLYHDEKQYYGSYENKTDIPAKELNKRRKTIGLPNYGYEEWRFKQLYPNEEY